MYFEGIRGAGAVDALGSESVHPGVPISRELRKWKFNSLFKENIGFSASGGGGGTPWTGGGDSSGAPLDDVGDPLGARWSIF